MSQELIENSQELEGSDSDAACKNMALEAWGTHAQHTPTAQQPFKLYESSASQAVVPVPSISNEFTEPPYNSAVKLNVQITNVPEVTNLKNTDDLKQVATGTFNGLKHSTEQLLEVLDHPKQLADAVVSGVQTTNTTAQYYSAHPQQIGSDTKKIFLATGQTVIDTLGSPLHQNEIGEHAGELMPDFVAFGKIKALDTKELEVLGGVEKLEQMSVAELEKIGIKRFDWSPLVEASEVPPDAYNNEITRHSIHRTVVDYIFNPSNKDGWPKGMWFQRALKFDPLNPEHQELLKNQIHFDPQKALPWREINPHKQYGPRWNQIITIVGPNDKSIDGIRLGWIQNKDGIVRIATIMPPK